MATFKEIRGQLIRKYTTNPTDPLEGQMWYNNTTGTLKGVVTSNAWSSSSPLVTARYWLFMGGTQTAALAAGGYTTASTNVTEEYNGSGWSAGGNLVTGRYRGSSGGTQTAGLAVAGFIAPPGATGVSAATEEYDGTTWTEVNAISGVSRSGQYLGNMGTQSSSLLVGGENPGGVLNLVEEYDGTNWTAGTVYPTPSYGGAISGASGTAALTSGGVAGGAIVNTSNTYNGTSWASNPTINTTRCYMSGFGTSTASLITGGVLPPGPNTYYANVEEYDGTSWSETADLSGVNAHMGGGGSTTAGVVFGGQTPTTIALTEEFNRSSSVITAGAWASAPALNNARKSMYSGNIGTPTSALAVGSSPASNLTEEYDGSSWTVQNVAPASLYGRGGAGTQTAALTFGGNPNPSVVTTTAEYDGANWTTGGVLNTGRGYGPIGAGTQTAGMAIGGWNPALPTYPPGYVTTVEFYNGASWTNQPAAGPSIYGGAGSGTQSAAWVAGRSAVSPAPVNKLTYEWDGSSWTAGGLYTMAAVANIFGGGPTTTAWVAAGDADPGLKVATNHYDGTAWSTAPNMATARDLGASTGANTASLAIGGGTPPASTTVEEFTGQTSAANIKTITTS